MRQWIIGCLLAGTWHVPLALAQTAENLDRLYAEAKAEGEVHFGGTLTEEGLAPVFAAFQARFPGIKITYSRRTTGPMVQLLEAQRRTRQSTFDIINLSDPQTFARWKQQKYTAPVAIPEAATLIPELIDPDGYSFAVGVTPMAGVYNTQQINETEAPRSLKEIMDPKWHGKIVVSRPTRGGTDAAALMSVVEAIGASSFFESLPKMEVLVTNGQEPAVSALISGERSLSWGVTGYRLVKLIADGAPIKPIWWQDGVAMASYPTGIIANAKHPKAGLLLLRFLLSPEAQRLMIQNLGVYSSRADIDDAPTGQPKIKDIHVRYIPNQALNTNGDEYVKQFDRARGFK